MLNTGSILDFGICRPLQGKGKISLGKAAFSFPLPDHASDSKLVSIRVCRIATHVAQRISGLLVRSW